jgi:hypothetical protein
MHPAALSPSDLADLLGYRRQADIERWCEAQGVRYFRGRAGIWTTVDALNAALGLSPAGTPRPPQTLEF